MEKKLRKKLFKVAFLGTLLLLTLIVAVSVAVFLSYTSQTLRTKAHLMKGSDLDYEKMINIFANENVDFRLTIIDEHGTAILDSKEDASTLENFSDRSEFRAALQTGEGSAIRFSPTDQSLLSYATRLDDYHVLRLTRIHDSFFALFRETILVAVLFAPVLLISSTMIARSLTKMVVNPVKKLATDMEKVDKQSSESVWIVPETKTNEQEYPEENYPELEPFIKAIKTRNMEILKNAQMRQDFTANLSHELKTPLTSISCYAELLESGMVSEEDAKEFYTRIRINAGTLLHTINDILHLSELDLKSFAFNTEPVDLYQLAKSCVEELQINAQKYGITLSMSEESSRQQDQTTLEPPLIKANKDMIQELLENLCSNALRYTNKYGTVKVNVKITTMPKTSEGTEVLTLAKEDSSKKVVALSVEDTGIGIPLEDQKRVFERFYRVDKGRSKESGGTGLGLSIVKHIVAQHDATLQLQSEVGKGTTITVLFPPLYS